jgi:hypothetical protein
MGTEINEESKGDMKKELKINKAVDKERFTAVPVNNRNRFPIPLTLFGDAHYVIRDFIHYGITS